MKYLFFICGIFIVCMFAFCKKDCKASEVDCTVIRYTCAPNEEVCGCDGKTYNCAMDAECSGKIAEYTKGKCKN